MKPMLMRNVNEKMGDDNKKSSTQKFVRSSSSQNQIQQLHSSIGNQAVQKLFEQGSIQAKLKIGNPNDKYEQEADRIAKQVMNMPEQSVVQHKAEENELIQSKPIANTITPLIQRQEKPEEEEDVQPGYDKEPEEPMPILESVPTGDADELDEEKEEFIQLKSNADIAPQITPGIANAIHSIKGSGKPLSASERAFFEPRFGTGFSDVRVHTDNHAVHTAQSINARAFTLGRDVVFGAGQYSPGSREGRSLLAHELTHVVQQGGGVYGKKRVLPPLSHELAHVIQRYKDRRRRQHLLVYHLAQRKRRADDKDLMLTRQYFLYRKVHGANTDEAVLACRLMYKELRNRRFYKRLFRYGYMKYYLNKARNQIINKQMAQRRKRITLAERTERPFPWTFVWKRRWTLPGKWRILGEEIELRYYREKKPGGSWCRDQFVLRTMYTTNKKRSLGKLFMFEGKMRGDVRYIRNWCKKSTQPRTTMEGSISWEGQLAFSPFGALLRKLNAKNYADQAPRIIIKPQIRITFQPPKLRGNYIRGKGSMLARGVLEIPLPYGVKGEIRYLLASCNFGVFEIGKSSFSKLTLLACIRQLVNTMQFVVRVRPTQLVLPQSIPSIPREPVLPSDIPSRIPNIIKRPWHQQGGF